jgi:hypothetical protein
MSNTQNDMTIHWCILKIDCSHIFDLNTRFSVTNAASYAAKHQFGIAEDIESFRRLFGEEISVKTSAGTRVFRRDGIAAQYPTDIQAEVLVKDEIPFSSIIAVCFQSAEGLAQAKAAMVGMNTDNFVVDSTVFSPDRRY